MQQLALQSLLSTLQLEPHLRKWAGSSVVNANAHHSMSYGPRRPCPAPTHTYLLCTTQLLQQRLPLTVQPVSSLITPPHCTVHGIHLALIGLNSTTHEQEDLCN